MNFPQKKTIGSCSIKKVLLVIGISLFLFMQLVVAQTIDRIVAVVNDEAITQSDVNRVMAALEAEYRAANLGEQELKQQLKEAKENIVNQMVEERLVVSFAKKNEIEVEEDLIQARIDKIKQLFPGATEFEQALAEQDLTLADLQARFREQEIMKKAVEYFVRTKIKIDPQELTQYYQAHQEAFFRPEKIKVNSLLFKVDGAFTEEEVLAKAQTVLERLKAGEALAALAEEDGHEAKAFETSELGYIEKGQLIPELDEAIFKLNPGEYSPVIKTPAGYNIFKVEEKQPKDILNFSEAQNAIRDRLYQEKFTQAFREWIDKLKQDALIEIK